MAGPTGYTGIYTDHQAFAVEQSLTKKFKLLWSSAHPLLAMIKSGGRFNKGFTVEGFRMILPVNYEAPTIPAAGVQDGTVAGVGAGEFLALVPNPTNGFVQAQFEFTHYRAAMWLQESERKLLKNGARGDILEGKSAQLFEDFNRQVSTDYATATAETRLKVLGLRSVTATANTVGGIPQTGNAWWQGGVQSAVGPFMLDLIDTAYDRINALGRAKPDLVLASYAAANNVYGKFRSAIAPAERIVNAKGKAEYGFTSFQYLSMMVVQDNRLGTAASGTAMVLSSDSWYLGGDEKPKAAPVQRLQGTSVDEHYYDWWIGTGVNDPAANELITGIT